MPTLIESALIARATDVGAGAFAARAFQRGDLIVPLRGRRVALPSRATIQIGWNIHIEAAPDVAWGSMNHSCAPNAWVRDGRLWALADIEAGGEVRFDYNANEFEMAAPFPCRCGHCSGAPIAGFRDLSTDERLRRSEWLAAYLRATL